MAATRAITTMGVVQVEGDGNCLFHALAYHEGTCGESLKVEIVDYMENVMAMEDLAVAEEWLEEADRLRGDPMTNWGGEMAMVAYSALRGRRVKLHIRQPDGTCQVREESHASVKENEALPTVHLLYNGVDHYDALIQLPDAIGFAPAWPQPPPPAYLKCAAGGVQSSNHESFPPLSHVQQPAQRQRASFAAPRPNRKPKAQAKPQGDAAAKPMSTQEKPAIRFRHPRYRQKTTPAPKLRASLLEDMANMRVAGSEVSSHPHRKLEDQIKARS